MRCGDCNGKVSKVYELKENGAVRVCESCFESYLEKWNVEKERWEQVKREAKIKGGQNDQTS